MEEKIIRFEALRKLVSEKFPESRHDVVAGVRGECEELPRGLLTEVYGSAGSVSLFVASVILREERSFAGWVDATNALEPGEFPESVLERLLWVRCRDAVKAVQAVDLLLRDGNLPLVFLDLRGVAAKAFGEIPASTWHRFQRLLEESPLALAVCTEKPCIAAARIRVAAAGVWKLNDLLRPREELLARLRAPMVYRGMVPATEERRIA